MGWNAMLLSAAVLAAPLSSSGVHAPGTTYRYAITSPHLGAIGTYVRTMDEANGLDRARSQLRVAVKILGIPVYREQSDETEAWRGGRLIAFDSRSTINAKPLAVHGELLADRLAVTTPKGTILAPVGTIAADPWASRRLGPATVVTIKTGQIMAIDTIGGETETVLVNGAPTVARHFHVNTSAQANRWEIWLDPRGVPVKFRSLEHGRAVDFTLMTPPSALAANPLALVR